MNAILTAPHQRKLLVHIKMKLSHWSSTTNIIYTPLLLVLSCAICMFKNVLHIVPLYYIVYLLEKLERGLINDLEIYHIAKNKIFIKHYVMMFVCVCVF